MVWMNAGGICERKTLFQIKKEADQAEFKGTRTGPKTPSVVTTPSFLEVLVEFYVSVFKIHSAD